IKMYDKHGIVLRIETTTNDVSFFKHHRKVEHRKGPATRGLAPVKKSIYSLIDLRDILLGCNRRYIAHLSALDDFSAGIRALGRLTKPREVDGKTVQGINFFAPVDKALLHALQRPRVNIAGIRRRELLADPRDALANPTVAATAPAAGPRGRQTRHRNLPLLPHQGRARRDRRGRMAHRGGCHSGYDLMGFGAGPDSMQSVARVAW
ncbi:MAG: hypothetical protein WBQ34_12150, partial [Candidatus Acidiferrales bacterium]